MSNPYFQWPYRGGVNYNNDRDASYVSTLGNGFVTLYTSPYNRSFTATPVVDSSSNKYISDVFHLYSLTTDGSLNWKSTTYDDQNNNNTPVISNGNIFVGTYRTINVLSLNSNSQTNTTQKFNFGNVLSAVAIFNNAAGMRLSSPIVYNNQLIAGGDLLCVYNISNPNDIRIKGACFPTSGNSTTDRNANDRFLSSPVVDSNGYIYIVGNIYDTGSNTSTLKLYVYNTSQITNTNNALPVPSYSPSVANNILPLWSSVSLGTIPGNIYAHSPVLSNNGYVYVIGASNTLYAFDTNQPSPSTNTNYLWQATDATDTTLYNSPTLGSDGTVFVTGKYGVYAFNPTNGSLKTHYAVDSSTVLVPCIGRHPGTHRDMIYTTSQRSSIVGLEYNALDPSLSLVFSHTLTYTSGFSNAFYDNGFSLDKDGYLYMNSFLTNDFKTYAFTNNLYPSSPTIDYIVPDNTSAQIYFSPPSFFGINSSSLAGYVVSTNGGSTFGNTIYPTTVPITINGLTIFTSYPIVIRAVNDYGQGTISNSISTTTSCFKEGTLILTERGYRRIEELQKGDRIHTFSNGYVPIYAIGKREIYHPAIYKTNGNQLYICRTHDYPELFEDLVITGFHSVLVREFANHAQREKTEKMLGDIFITDDHYRLPVCLDPRSDVYKEKGFFTIYHFSLENPSEYENYGIFANGLLVETCSKRYLTELSDLILLG